MMSSDTRQDLVNKWRDRLAKGPLSNAEESHYFDQILAGQGFGRLVRDLEALDVELVMDHRLYRRHMSISFNVACCLMTAGLLIILIGCLATNLGSTTDQAWATLIAGVVTKAVAALPFWLWLRASSNVDKSSLSLNRHRDLLRAVHLIADMPKGKQSALIECVIERLLSDQQPAHFSAPC